MTRGRGAEYVTRPPRNEFTFLSSSVSRLSAPRPASIQPLKVSPRGARPIRALRALERALRTFPGPAPDRPCPLRLTTSLFLSLVLRARPPTNPPAASRPSSLQTRMLAVAAFLVGAVALAAAQDQVRGSEARGGSVVLRPTGPAPPDTRSATLRRPRPHPPPQLTPPLAPSSTQPAPAIFQGRWAGQQQSPFGAADPTNANSLECIPK